MNPSRMKTFEALESKETDKHDDDSKTLSSDLEQETLVTFIEPRHAVQLLQYYHVEQGFSDTHTPYNS